MSSSDKTETMHRVTKKAFRFIQSWKKTYHSSHESDIKVLASFANFCDQYQCCDTVSIEHTPLRDFADIKGKLLYKIVDEIEAKVAVLQQSVEMLEQNSETLSKMRTTVEKVYADNASTLHSNIMVLRTETCPSLADMLEWIVDIDSLLSQQLFCKQYCLECLRYDDPATVQNICDVWKYDTKICQTIDNYLMYLDLYLEVT